MCYLRSKSGSRSGTVHTALICLSGKGDVRKSTKIPAPDLLATMRAGAMLARHENLSEVVVEDIAVDMVVVDNEHYAVVMLCGEIDCYSAPGLQERLLNLAASARRPLILDMSGVTFCDGSALRMLSATERECAGLGVLLAVIGLRPFLANLFRAFGVHERIPLCAALDEAVWKLLPPTDADLHAWLDASDRQD